MTDAHQRYHALDGMRGIAAFFVMFYHYNSHSRSFEIWEYPLFNASGLSVDLFFILSGFALSYSYSEKIGKTLTIQDYFLKRLARLYPFYFIGMMVGVLASFILVGTEYSTFNSTSIVEALIFNSAYIPYANTEIVRNFGDIEPTKGEIFPLNPPAWSLYFEIIASILFIYICKWPISRLMSLCSMAFIGFIIFGFFNALALGKIGFIESLGWAANNFSGGFPRTIFSFGLGILIFKNDEIRRRVKSLFSGTISLPILYVALALSLSLPSTLQGIYSIFFLLILAPVMVVLAVENQDRGHWVRIFSNWIGWLSYPVYCLHFPVGRIVYFYGRKIELSEVQMFSASVVAVVLLSLSCAYFIDGPVRARLSKYIEDQH